MIALTLNKIKFMSRGILFIILLIFFYFLFMEPALQKFTDGATTIVQSQEKNVQPDPPVLVICPDPPFKPSYFKQNGFEDFSLHMYFWRFYDKYTNKFHNDSSIMNIYKSMSLELGVDWHIQIVDDKGKTVPLKTGSHNYFGKEINVNEIPTIVNGLCYKLDLISKDTIPADSKKSNQFFKLRIFSWTQEIDKLSRVRLLIASKNTWQGILFAEWPYSKNPPIVVGDVKENLIHIDDIKLEENTWNYQTGTDDFKECLSMQKKANCTSIFDPSAFNMSISSLCSDWTQHGISTSKSYQSLQECLNQKSFTQYLVKIQVTEIKDQQTLTEFHLRFQGKMRITHKEVLIFDSVGLLSSLGGALGLFVGFSFFDYIGKILDLILDKGATRLFQKTTRDHKNVK